MSSDDVERMRRTLYADVYKIMLERGRSPFGDAQHAATYAVASFDAEFAPKTMAEQIAHDARVAGHNVPGGFPHAGMVAPEETFAAMDAARASAHAPHGDFVR